ncbi:AAA family ATPase [Oceanicaulis sp. LC35]|uniref:AAA family ATPase n=1 Tax=Oceanicaulis sp. LC35 TaxID=3349635 RepID=UPI003F85C617
MTAPIHGFVLGKFMPPHAGHMYLCDFAAGLCDQLTILVCSLDREPIPGKLRHEWMSALYPNARVLHYDRDIPQDPSEHPRFWDIWRELIRSIHPEPIHRVFASDEYGLRLGQELGAEFWPADPERVCRPVSGTQIRQNPIAHWSMIAPPARPYFTRTIVLHGPESTGKSVLGQTLADKLGGAYVPEFGRTWCELYGTECSAQDLRNIAAGQAAGVEAARRTAEGLVFSDTDGLITEVWSQMMLGRSVFEPAPEPEGDLYLLTDIDQPWIDDGTRVYGDDADRRRFMELSIEALERRGVDYVRLSGDWDVRERTALAAIRDRFPQLCRER